MEKIKKDFAKTAEIKKNLKALQIFQNSEKSKSGINYVADFAKFLQAILKQPTAIIILPASLGKQCVIFIYKFIYTIIKHTLSIIIPKESKLTTNFNNANYLSNNNNKQNSDIATKTKPDLISNYNCYLVLYNNGSIYNAEDIKNLLLKENLIFANSSTDIKQTLKDKATTVVNVARILYIVSINDFTKLESNNLLYNNYLKKRGLIHSRYKFFGSKTELLLLTPNFETKEVIKTSLNLWITNCIYYLMYQNPGDARIINVLNTSKSIDYGRTWF